MSELKILREKSINLPILVENEPIVPISGNLTN